MKLVIESAIRREADLPTLAMLELWHNLVKEKTDTDFEVLIGDRHSVKEMSSFKGELNTAFPNVINGKPCLVLWVDNTNNVFPIIITHEIGHWVLKLQGFQGIKHLKTKDIDIGALLGSMCHHPPLYVLQRQLGHEPQNEIDDRAKSNIQRFTNTSINSGLKDAFLITDDLLNCSEEFSVQLKNIVSQKHRNVWTLVDIILSLSNDFDLLKPQGNLQFLRKTMKKLKLDKEFYEPDEILALKNMA